MTSLFAILALSKTWESCLIVISNLFTIYRILCLEQVSAPISSSAASFSRNTNNHIKAFITYVRPLLEYASSVWSPSYLYLITHIESVQRSFTKHLPFCKSLSYAERLANLKLQSLEHRRLIFDLVLVFKIIHGFSCLNFTDFFSFANNNKSSRGHSYRLCIPLNKSNTRNFFFSSRVVPAWNSLPASTVAAPNPISFKKALFKHNLSKFLEFPSVFAL